MSNESQDRFWLPILIPVGALAFILLISFSMSRILLNLPKILATSVALMIAFNILTACALVAMRPRMNSFQKMLMAAVSAVPLVLGGLVAAGAVEVKGGEEHHETEKGPAIAISAKNTVFSAPQLKVPADEAFKLEFKNEDPAPHNVTILKEQGSTEALFKKAPFGGPKSVTWEVEPIKAGTYFFQCDVHPNMTGEVVAE